MQDVIASGFPLGIFVWAAPVGRKGGRRNDGDAETDAQRLLLPGATSEYVGDIPETPKLFLSRAPFSDAAAR